MPEHPKPPVEFWTAERCYISEILNDERCPDVSVARCRVEPGVTTELHALTVLEWYIIEAGRGRMRIGTEPVFDVAPGDAFPIPADCAQQITNTGDTDLLFFCVCVPRFTHVCYSSLE